MAGRDNARRKLTYEDYVLFPEDGKRHEILDGVHYVTPAPPLEHQDVSMNLCRILVPFIREHRLGRAYHAPVDVLLSEHDIAQPDLVFVSNEHASILTHANIQGAPDLVIEILSDSSRRRDETLKREIYERAGVLEYWLVDPKCRSVRVYRRAGAGFLAPQDFSVRNVLATPLLPGLEIPVREVFE